LPFCSGGMIIAKGTNNKKIGGMAEQAEVAVFL
jgi:hypothetical protein